MAVTKKAAFERWVAKSFKRRFQEESREKQRFARERMWRSWKEWLTLETTQKAVGPLVALIILSGFTGWSIGVSNMNSTPFILPSEQTGVR